jgi:lysozyme
MPLIPDQHKNKAAAVAIAAALAAPLEGMRQYAYYDPPGILTVCEGHTGKDVVKGRKYSLDECRAYMTADMTKAVDQVAACTHADIPKNVLAAFSDAAYNIGSKVACNRSKSTAAKYLWRGEYIAACNELPKWDKAYVAGVLVALPGLTKRRHLERDLCLEGLS